MSRRFIIEGGWSGYSSGHERLFHRTVHRSSFKKLRAWAEKTHGIRFTDGTILHITVRDAKPRERVQEKHGYDRLIDDCQFYDVDSVAALQAAQKAKAAA